MELNTKRYQIAGCPFSLYKTQINPVTITTELTTSVMNQPKMFSPHASSITKYGLLIAVKAYDFLAW
jgi:hypothetical protein